jgi:hypothetical protein
VSPSGVSDFANIQRFRHSPGQTNARKFFRMRRSAKRARNPFICNRSKMVLLQVLSTFHSTAGSVGSDIQGGRGTPARWRQAVPPQGMGATPTTWPNGT